MARRSIFNAGVHGSLVWHDDYTSGVTVREVLDAVGEAIIAESMEHHAPDSTAMAVLLAGADVGLHQLAKVLAAYTHEIPAEEEAVEEVVETEVDFESMTRDELQDLARERGVSTSGTKAALIERLS